MRRRREVPFISQTTEVDCGAACLTMALNYHGLQVAASDVRSVMEVGRDGVDAVAIMAAASRLGHLVRAIRIELHELEILPTGTILHWEFRHFVVFECVVKTGAVIIDPNVGRRRVDHGELGRALTGIALVIERDETSHAVVPASRHPTRALLWSRLRAAPEVMKILVASVALQVLVGLFPLLTASIVDWIVPLKDSDTLTVLAFGLAWLTVFFGAFTLVRGYLLANLRTRLDIGGAVQLLEHLVSLPLRFFQHRTPGDLLVRVRSNETLREALAGGILASVLDGMLALLYVLILIWVNRSIALVVAALTVVQVLTYIAVRRRQRELIAETQHCQALADNHLIDLLTGIETLKAAGAELRAVASWTDRYVAVLNASLLRMKMSAWSDAITNTIYMAGPFVVLLVGTPAVLAGATTLGTMVSALALAQAVIYSTANFLGNLGKFDTLGALVDRLDDVFLAPPEEPTPRRLAPPLQGALSITDVSYRPTPTGPFLLRDVTLNIEPGSFVALVGESGSGKSTLAAVMGGMLEPSGGTIRFDGIDVGSMNLRGLRRQLGVVVQRPQIFGETIGYNITLLEHFAMTEVVAAARLACIHDEIMTMRMGYETPLVAGGSISGGQRQRIALARALLRKPKILILDEATSSLDAITEHRIFDNLRTLGCTRIVVAHRMSTVIDADVIAVLKDGRIVETGTHYALLRRGGHYARLIAAQTQSLATGAEGA